MENTSENSDYLGYDLLEEVANSDPSRNIFFNAFDYFRPENRTKMQHPGAIRDQIVDFGEQYIRWLADTQGYTKEAARSETYDNIKAVVRRMETEGGGASAALWKERYFTIAW